MGDFFIGRRASAEPNGVEVNPLMHSIRCSRKSAFFAAVAFLLLPSCCAAQAGNQPARQALSTEQIVTEMVARNKTRAAALPDYTTRQICQLHYHGFPSDRRGEMVLDIHYTAGASKRYTLVSESGSKFVIDHVLKRLLEGEQEAQNAKNLEETALTPRNYRFSLTGQKSTPEGSYYILHVEPKIRNKFLFRGDVWVDQTDFAVARVVAAPAKNPSFWITDSHIEQQYEKFGSFWLPVQNQSTSKIRVVGGTATLLIQYKDYSLAGIATTATAIQPTKGSD